MQTTKLSTQSILPLTCSRSGTCCFGKEVMLNPWELLSFSREKKITPIEFRDLYCDFGGIRLTFNGKEDKKGQKSCSQYINNFGCSVHSGRPLACRLYPLGRQIQSNKAHYIFEGKQFPCLTDCNEVLELNLGFLLLFLQMLPFNSSLTCMSILPSIFLPFNEPTGDSPQKLSPQEFPSIKTLFLVFSSIS